MGLFFRKKKKVVIENNKFKEGEMVKFRRYDELMFGYVYEVKLDKEEKVIYDIQVCGQCPYIIYDMAESELSYYTPPKI